MPEDLFLLHCRNNDNFARYCRNSMILSSQEEAKLHAKYRKCKHLFVVVKEAQYIGAFNSSDCETIPELVECVHCGLTNRFIEIEDCLQRSGGENFDNVRARSYATEEFVKQFGWNSEKIGRQRFLSKEVLPSCHPDILFQIARELYFAARDLIDTGESDSIEESIFVIMRELHNMETPLEQFKISSITHASALIERYKKTHFLDINSTP